MKAPKTLGRPTNWQDFETLCKILWGEIWNCPEIKKNGRQGQDQYGVDVYGIPAGENDYFGIQCKGKDVYNHKQLTKKEIDLEIIKAQKFKPKLKKFYFATTASKDGKIEEYIRIKNQESRVSGLFEIHLFCWEDIVDLIESNKRTYDFYVRSQNYQSMSSISVTFPDGSTEKNCSSKFIQKIQRYRRAYKTLEMDSLNLPSDLHQQVTLESVIRRPKFINPDPIINKSYFDVTLLVKNTGSEAIKNFKILLEFQGNIRSIDTTNAAVGVTYVGVELSIDQESLTGIIRPRNSMLVSDEPYLSDKIFIKPDPEVSRILIKWRLISLNFQDQGILSINYSPEIIQEYEDIQVNTDGSERTVYGDIQDLLSTD